MLDVYGAPCAPAEARRTAYALLRHALGGPDPLPEILREEQGKPWIPGGPAFSLAHTRTMALCAVSDEPVGVDAETVRPLRPGVARLSLQAHEQAWAAAQPDFDRAFLTLWTAKEAYVKLTGAGLQWRPKAVGLGWENGVLTVPGTGLRFETREHGGVLITVCTGLAEPAAWHWPDPTKIFPDATAGCANSKDA